MPVIKIRKYRVRTILLFIFMSVTLVTGMLFYIEYSKYVEEERLSDEHKKQVYVDRMRNAENNDECNQVEEFEFYTYTGSDPLWEENNKFGIYIYAEEDEFFDRAEELVNTGKGDWGYVLIPFNVKDTAFEKWNGVFRKLREKHLIPVIQLWDVDTDNYKEQTVKAAEFLNRFVWPIRYRYVSVYNEPNDKNFWYGRVDPEGYAEILNFTIDTFKQENADFFMLNGAFNVSAPTDSNHLDSLEYMRRMEIAVPGVFSKLDGWASHPYPQPNFSGSPYNEGRWSIKAYETELSFLEVVLKVEKELPVFITETGWAHAEGVNYNPSYLPVETVAEYTKKAFEDVWLKDDRVRAVMPFTIKYEPPFDHFSWLNGDNVPYKHFDTIRDMKKISGKPPAFIINQMRIGDCD